MHPKSPRTVIQEQLDAYNAKDIEALLATYAPDAEQFTLHGERFAKGHEELRPRFLARFCEPDLHARLLSRTVMANVVVDLEKLMLDTFAEQRMKIRLHRDENPSPLSSSDGSERRERRRSASARALGMRANVSARRQSLRV